MNLLAVTREESGFTMLETLVSIAIFGIFSATMINTVLAFVRRINETQVQTEAVAIANRKFDELRQERPDALPSSGTVGPEAARSGEFNFQIFTTYCGTAALCPSSRTRHVRVDVRLRGRSVFDAESVFTRLR